MKSNFLLSLFFSLGFLAASAQNNKGFTNSFGSRSLSIGINGGFMSPYSGLLIGNRSHELELNGGYGFFVKKQLSNHFAAQLDFHGGSLSDRLKSFDATTTRRSFDTELAYTVTAQGTANIVKMDVFRQQKSIVIYGKAGAGIAAYAPSYITGTNEEIDLKNKAGKDRNSTYSRAAVFPAGLGIKTGISSRFNLNGNYSVYFLKADNLDGPTNKGSDRWSYASLGLEYLLK